MFIEDETLTGDGSETTFTLQNPFKPGTVKILIDDKLSYEFYESDASTGEIEFTVAPSASQEVLVSYYDANEANTLNQIRYVTPAQAMAQSRVTTLTAMDVGDIETLIREVEFYIDDYVGASWRKLYNDNGQMLLFPRVEDAKILADSTYPVDYSGIPYEVTRAALFALENLALIGTPTADDGLGAITSESMGDYSYSRAQIRSNVGDSGELLGKRARALLNKFRRNFRKLRLDDDNYPSDALLNSRQRFTR